MSYDVSSVYSSLLNSGALNNTKSTSGTNTSDISSLISSLSSSSNSSSSDMITGMMIGLMCSASGNSNNLSGSSNGGGSSNSGFSVMMSSLLKAMNEKNKQTQQGLDQNSGASSDTTSSNLNDVLLRTLGVSTGNTTTATGTDSEQINNAIAKASATYGVDESLIRAIVQVESNYNPNAASSAGAKGLMQLMPCNISSYGVTNPYDIEENINAGTQYIKSCLNRYNNDLNMALVAYNYGSGNMASRGISSSSDFYKLPEETKNYIVKINSILSA